MTHPDYDVGPSDTVLFVWANGAGSKCRFREHRADQKAICMDVQTDDGWRCFWSNDVMELPTDVTHDDRLPKHFRDG